MKTYMLESAHGALILVTAVSEQDAIKECERKWESLYGTEYPQEWALYELSDWMDGKAVMLRGG